MPPTEQTTVVARTPKISWHPRRSRPLDAHATASTLQAAHCFTLRRTDCRPTFLKKRPAPFHKKSWPGKGTLPEPGINFAKNKGAIAIFQQTRASTGPSSTQAYKYILSMVSWYLLSTTFRLSFKVGVSSVPWTEKSIGKISNFWILLALLGQTNEFLLVSAIACSITLRYSALAAACGMVLTSGMTEAAGPTSSSDPGSSPVAPTVFNVTRQVLYFFLSPTIMQLEIAGQSFLMFSSIGTGATFSPPAVMINSLYRPVTFTMPFCPMTPMSPLWSQPSSSIASAVCFSIWATCSAPKSGLAMYPIMMWRPRKHNSPCSSSVGLKMSFAGGHSFLFLPSTLNTFTCTPGAADPQLPQRWCSSVDTVVIAELSLIP
mmetsp:Transcript_2433/g.5540  ORF Transcript_2433/g.5540 Transcript_2433/m.5540 type:complete len:375 (-) Transcript_2433:2658-3782(-)